MVRSSRPARLAVALTARAQQAWRRSLQLRVITITLVCSGALVATFGLLLSRRITDGLVTAKENAAVAIVRSDTPKASDQLNSLISDPNDTVAAANVASVLNPLRDRSGADVEIVAEDNRARQLNTVSSLAVPADLIAAVSKDEFVDQRVTLDLGHGSRLYLVVGRKLVQKWGNLQIFYFFPMEGEVALANEFGNIITITGLALVIMLTLVVSLVTRMVVSPVRVAARTAQRLSNGLLDQRMEVTGEDDLAALAASFNQMAENLQRHILRLEEMSRLQRRFTSDVSHELRTPLTTVRMAADLIFSEREGFAAPVARSAELLQAELDRFENLLAELLEISRFDAGFAALDAEPADLGPLVMRVVVRLRPVAERAGVVVDVDLPADPVVAEVDVRRVERILRNLIGNAIEHADRRPVKVRLAAREGAAAVTVRDHGVGLKSGEEKLVFNRFWRADPSRARHTGGTGLGLSISSEDARLHGGWLEAWGAPGQGAQFRLTLPTRAGDRLVSSPLRLVPTDLRPPVDFVLTDHSAWPEDVAPLAPAASAPAASGDAAPAGTAASADAAPAGTAASVDTAVEPAPVAEAPSDGERPAAVIPSPAPALDAAAPVRPGTHR